MKNRNIKFAEQTSLMKVPHSPVDATFDVRILDEMSARYVIEAYIDQFENHIEYYVFGDSLLRYQYELTKLDSYRCITSRDGKFFESLVNFDWVIVFYDI